MARMKELMIQFCEHKAADTIPEQQNETFWKIQEELMTGENTELTAEFLAFSRRPERQRHPR